MPKNFESNAKQLIRLSWSKSILNYLYNIIGSKLVYLGLPSENPEDIKSWIEYLDKVYAFQCREYPLPSEPSQSREKVLTLERKLREFERKNMLSFSTVYDGYIEEVVLRGYDNNPQPITFSHENVITLYNLDFCNQIASPQEYLLSNGDIRKAYKFDAIKELLNYQNRVHQLPKKFILFLTINASYKDEHIIHFTRDTQNEYFKSLSSLKGIELKARVLKAFVFENLRDAFKQYGFIPEFLPTILYKGVGGFNMMHFTVLGTYEGPTPGGVIIPQKSSYLNKKFLGISDGNFSPRTSKIIDETNIAVDVLRNLEKSLTIKKFWKKN